MKYKIPGGEGGVREGTLRNRRGLHYRPAERQKKKKHKK